MSLPTEAGENTNQSQTGAQGQFINNALTAEKNSKQFVFSCKKGGNCRLFNQFAMIKTLNSFDCVCDLVCKSAHLRFILTFNHHTNEWLRSGFTQ